jgi:hypothetical protein
MYKNLPEPVIQKAIGLHNSKLEGYRAARNGWLGHWGALSQNFQPRRYKWFISANDVSRGTAQNSYIVDETGLLAARYLAAGMLTGLTSPTKPWFRLGLEDQGLDQYGPVKLWLSEVERRMFRVLAHSNYYQSMATFYLDESIFGSASKIIYRDPQDVIRCYNPCLGEYFFGTNNRQAVDKQYREFTFTVDQAVAEFGEKDCSRQIQENFKRGGAARTREVVICHAMEPNEPIEVAGEVFWLVPKKFPYRECYWERGSTPAYLRCKGFPEQPFSAGRWLVTSNDPYGSGPGMEALPAISQLRTEQLRKGEGIDKQVRPPMVAHVSMKNEPKSCLPGETTYVVDTQNAGYKPAYQVNVDLNAMMLDIKEVQSRVDAIFYKDLFMAITSLDTVRTATDIDARREEKMIMIGPVVERNENEVLDVDLKRVYGIMQRQHLLPPPPPEIHGKALQIRYISMLSELQRASSTAGIDRIWQLAGGIAAAKPAVLDKLSEDRTIDVYADLLNIDPRIFESATVIAQIRAARAQQQQQQAALQAGVASAQAGKVLSDTQLGGGNALEAMTGMGQ